MGHMKEIEIKIPNLGEAEATEVIEVAVKVGDEVKKNDPLIVLESEKAAMEVPSDYSGKVKEISITEGESVKEGQSFIVMEVNIDAGEDKKEDDSNQASQEKEKITKPLANEAFSHDFSGINAGPAVRKIARELEIDLQKIKGTGNNSMITKEDLKKHIHSSNLPTETKYAQLDELKDFGDFILEKQTKIKNLGAKNLHNSWVSIPHVTHFEEIDITLIEKQRRE